MRTQQGNDLRPPTLPGRARLIRRQVRLRRHAHVAYRPPGTVTAPLRRADWLAIWFFLIAALVAAAITGGFTVFLSLAVGLGILAVHYYLRDRRVRGLHLYLRFGRVLVAYCLPFFTHTLLIPILVHVSHPSLGSDPVLDTTSLPPVLIASLVVGLSEWYLLSRIQIQPNAREIALFEEASTNTCLRYAWCAWRVGIAALFACVLTPTLGLYVLGSYFPDLVALVPTAVAAEGCACIFSLGLMVLCSLLGVRSARLTGRTRSRRQ